MVKGDGGGGGGGGCPVWTPGGGHQGAESRPVTEVPWRLLCKLIG